MPLQNFTEEILTRLEEFENTLIVTKELTFESKTNIIQIASQKEDLFKLCKRIDDLERFIDITEKEIMSIESVVNVAEEELGFKEDKKLSFLFKKLFNKHSKQTNLSSEGSFHPPIIADSSSYFEMVEIENEDLNVIDHNAQDALLDVDFFKDVEEDVFEEACEVLENENT